MIEREVMITKHKSKKRRWPTQVLLIVFVFGLCIGMLSTSFIIPRIQGVALVNKDYLDYASTMAEKYGKMEYLNTLIQKFYYQDVDGNALMEGAYRGLFSSLDQYSAYLSEEEYSDLRNYTNAAFEGVGLLMTLTEDNQIIVSGVYDNSPAMKAGIKEGDIITAVDDVKYDGDTFSQCADAMRKEAGQKSKLTYLRGDKEYTKTITCGLVETGTVYSQVFEEDGKKLGYIRIYTFGHKTADEFDQALRDMELDGTQAFILDLRSNGGGEVDAATAIADRLLPEGQIMVTKSKVEGESRVNSKSGCTKLPYVVLVNGHTASASEILTAAIKGNDAAPIIGEKTFGKGVLQSIGQISKDSKDAFKITYAEYFGPNNLKINSVGIEPDYKVTLSAEDEKDMQFAKAVELALEKCD